MMTMIPEVKQVTSKSGCCRLDDARILSYAGLNPETLALLKRRFGSLEERKTDSGLFVELQLPGVVDYDPVDAGDEADAYVLRVFEDRVRIDANTSSGLFYGVQTLLQLPAIAPCQEIRDHAALKLRMLHWDLKGYQPTVEAFEKELYLLASFKINSILLEVEDKYNYRCAPEVGVSDAYSFKDFRRISQVAKALNITIIPKLQCLAHVDYLLKHKRYAHLREDGHVFQYCASNEEAQRLWEDMAEELMECFAEHTEYFHVGADETDLLGKCPECAKLGKMGSYMKKVGSCLDFLIAHGRKPVMWEDILRNLHGNMTDQEAVACRKLSEKAILMYWAYGYGGKKNTFPYLHDYLERGATVWGASGFGGCDNWAGSVPPLTIRAQNIDAWTKSAVENRLEGVVATGWTKIASADCPAEPQESSWFTSLYAAQSMWAGKPMNLDTFVRKLALRLYGEELDEDLAAAVMNIAAHPYVYDKIATVPAGNDRLQFLRYAAAAESLVVERSRILNYMQYYEGFLGREMVDYRLNLLRNYSASLTDKLTKFKAEMTAMLRLYYAESTVQEFIRTRFGHLERLAAELKAKAAQTKAF